MNDTDNSSPYPPLTPEQVAGEEKLRKHIEETLARFDLKPCFRLTRLGMQRNVNEDPEAAEAVIGLVLRHLAGDWGNVDADDAAANDEVIRTGEGRLLSSYEISPGKTVWLITDDLVHGPTTALFPEDY